MTILEFYQHEFDRLENLMRDSWIQEDEFKMLWGRLLESVEQVCPGYEDDTILIEDDE